MSINPLESPLHKTPKPLKLDTTASISICGGAVKLNVVDEGRGFREADTKKIFKRFYSNRPDKFGEHSGLGLNIVKNLVELHNGSITAKNNKDKGANVEIIFPRDNS